MIGKFFLMIVVSQVFFVDFSFSNNSRIDEVYREAQREFEKSNYQESLVQLKNFVLLTKNNAYKRERLVWVLDQVGYIYLRVQLKPDLALSFYASVLKELGLNKAEEMTIKEWIAAATEWKKHLRPSKSIHSADRMFEVGKKYFELGVLKNKTIESKKGDAYLHISASYLVPFITKNDNHEKIGEALYMMGLIKMHTWTDPEYWSQNFYLKEVIRRFPHSKLAQKAYWSLSDDIRAGYTGSSGDYTPPSILKMLSTYRKLAFPVVGKKK